VQPAGAVRHIESHAVIRRSESGVPLRIIGVNRDITSEIEAEHRLMQAQKMEAIGQLTGGIAHDFNNLLAVVLGNLEFMDDILEPDSELAVFKDNATRATLRGAELTQRLLAFSRRQTLLPVATDVNELVNDLTALLNRTLGERVDIKCRVGDGLAPVMIDPGQLENALLNMAINARDAMPGGGTLVIETENAETGPETAGEDTAAGPFVVISLTDSGVGIPESLRDRIFEPFFTTKEFGKGSGLGLSMVYGFVKQSGGHITVDKGPGKGTVFRLYLPQARPTELHGMHTALPDDSMPGGSESILVVEDELAVRDNLCALLKRLGYQVYAANDGAEALDLLDSIPRVDMLIMDMVMPRGMDGLAVADAVRERRGPVKVLFTSGYAERANTNAGEPGSGTAFLPKPYRRTVLAQVVRHLLDET
jgi:signal transduction histidine kinase